MVRRTKSLVLEALFAVLALPACSDGGSSSNDAGTDSSTDSDTGGPCLGDGVWFDPTSGLCWEEPPSTVRLTWDEAVEYCDSLTLGGFDWELPTIDQLRSLIRGGTGNACDDSWNHCSENEPGGACGVTDPDCLDYDTCYDDCGCCEQFEGPDDDPAGCYWDPALSGECSRYWSSSLWVYSPPYAMEWKVNFLKGLLSGPDPDTYNFNVRCVRQDP